MKEQKENAEVEPAAGLQTVAGFYDFSDPKYIYVKAGQGKVLESEVTAHETFHRTYCNSTVYGTVFMVTDDFLRQCGSKLDRELHDMLLGLRNKLIENMYQVQEGGAVTRALLMQPYLHDAASQETLDHLEASYFQRLIPEYRQMGHRYFALVQRLFPLADAPWSLILCNYANDALTLFLMNPYALAQGQEVSMSPSDSVFLSDAVAPDTRLGTVEGLLSSAELSEACGTAMRRFLSEEFGCEDCSIRADFHLHEAIKNDRENFEHRIHHALHRGLDAVIPNFAISLHDYEAYQIAMAWRTHLDEAFGRLVPDYEPAKVAFVITQEEKRWAAKLVKPLE